MIHRLHLPAIVAAALLMAGCASSPPEHFYSLSTGMGAPAARSGAAPAPDYYVEIPAVTVPQQVARSQLVVTKDGRMDLLEQERWTSPPAAEIGQALSQVVTADLGVVDVFRTPTPEGATVYRISTNVQRFESAPGQYALLDAVWSVRQVGSQKTLTCRTVASETVGAGYETLVAGHRRAVARLGADIARAVRALAANGSASCQA
ncbi:MAG: PqiC family protein [Duganella sp.]